MSQPSEPAGTDFASTAAVPAATRARPIALLVDLEPSLATLIAEWLDDIGVDACIPARDASRDRAVDLVVVDVPYPRREGAQRVGALAAALPRAPILALSSTFFAGVAASGSVARDLGAAAVLPAPVGRDALVAAVRRLLAVPR
jgi:DNA-binding response OmpR family regulator